MYNLRNTINITGKLQENPQGVFNNQQGGYQWLFPLLKIIGLFWLFCLHSFLHLLLLGIFGKNHICE